MIGSKFGEYEEFNIEATLVVPSVPRPRPRPQPRPDFENPPLMLPGDHGKSDLGVVGVEGVNGKPFEFDLTDMGLSWDDAINEHLLELEGDDVETP
ncbi:hypothetical protein LIER_30282 [Lithospermum erythrorhizon]|uniref:Uncharacterized protein n=1 Tax=Lithospermum erythrorhizon TaxID=34254 RepID=A0AAV3RQD6_LITER